MTRMDAPRWERMQALFHAAIELPASERPSYLLAQCADDSALLRDVSAMLEEDAAGDSLLDRGVAGVAHRMLGGRADAPLPRGDFGPYRIKSVLGEGGMGVVYLAERQDLGSTAAIKILRDASLSPARRERFAAEQRTLAQLNHRSIAHLYDADTLPDGTPWFAMEYVEGVTLTAYCDARALGIPDRLRIFRDVCDAVQHAHQHAIIHRDLKPSNILVRHDGAVKLLDFGIAKQLESLDLPGDQTRTGLRLMTPAYAAPEQIRGGRLGVYTDVYSLGVVLYELLAGRLPFDLSNRTPGEAESMIAEQEPERPSSAARGSAATSSTSHSRAVLATRGSWADLDVLCLTAMRKDPERRYHTVDALVRDIDHYLHGEPLEARPDSVRYRAGKFVRRNRQSVVAAALVVTTIVGVAFFYTVRLASARNAALTEAARTQRIQRFMLNLFEGGDDAVGPADSLRVVTLVDRGVQEARILDSEPFIQAELYQTLGGIYQKLGNLDRADTLLRAALDRRRTLLGNEHSDAASSAVALGLLRVDQAQFEEGEQLIRDGLAIHERTLPPDHPAIAEATAALGKVLEERGKYDDATSVLGEAVRLYSASGETTRELARVLSELANTHFYAGRYPTSDSLNRRVLAMTRQLYGERHPLVADDLINLGAIRFEMGEYKEAEAFYRQALDITQRFYGGNHHRTASNLTMLARAIVRQERDSEAVALLTRALAIQERTFGPVHPRVASALNELGQVAFRQKRLGDADAHFEHMGAIYRSVYGDKHYLIAIALSNRGSVAVERKEYAKAEQIYRDVIRRFSESLSPEHLNTGIARIKLGRSLVRQQRFAEAESESRAGYDVLARQNSPSLSWLDNARTDLVMIYDSLRQPAKASRFRSELARTTAAVPPTNAGK